MYKIFILSQKKGLVFDFFDLNKSYPLKEAFKILDELRRQNVMAMYYNEENSPPNIENVKYRIFISSKEDDMFLDFFDPEKSYFIDEAIEIVKKIRKQKIAANFYPEEYATPKITPEQAMKTALTAYNKAVAEKPENYGEFRIGGETPIFYWFYCIDFEAEAAGRVPGQLTIYIDKLNGEIMPSSMIREYRNMNDSF